MTTPSAKCWLLRKEFANNKDFAFDDATAVGGIIPSGTIYPAQGATAVGIVINDTEVAHADGTEIQNGNRVGALLTKGVVDCNNIGKKDYLPILPTAATITALKGIQFFKDGAPYAGV